MLFRRPTRIFAPMNIGEVLDTYDPNRDIEIVVYHNTKLDLLIMADGNTTVASEWVQNNIYPQAFETYEVEPGYTMLRPIFKDIVKCAFYNGEQSVVILTKKPNTKFPYLYLIPIFGLYFFIKDIKSGAAYESAFVAVFAVTVFVQALYQILILTHMLK